MRARVWYFVRVVRSSARLEFIPRVNELRAVLLLRGSRVDGNETDAFGSFIDRFFLHKQPRWRRACTSNVAKQGRNVTERLADNLPTT